MRDVAAYEQQHYTVKALAQKWALSPKTVRRLFKNEPGVVCLGTTSSRRDHKRIVRRYATLTIPELVVARVYARITKKAE